MEGLASIMHIAKNEPIRRKEKREALWASRFCLCVLECGIQLFLEMIHLEKVWERVGVEP
jgi:hypothetical protein